MSTQSRDLNEELAAGLVALGAALAAERQLLLDAKAAHEKLLDCIRELSALPAESGVS